MDAYTTLDPLETRIRTHREYSRHPDDVETAVSDALGLAEEASLLDVGCGTGTFFDHLRRLGCSGRFVGLDTSAAALERVRGVGHAHTVLAGAERLPFPEASFDAVTARHMLYHVPDPDRALREARRISRPGARVVVSVNHADVLPRITAMVREEVARRGVDPPDHALLVNSGDLPHRMAAVFDDVAVVRRDNELVFHEPAPVIRYAVSVLALYGMPPRAEGYAEVVDALDRRVHSWFATGGVPWTDPKGYTVCVGVRGQDL